MAFKVAKGSGMHPFLGPLLNTATLGWSARTSTGLLLRSRPWWVDWKTSTSGSTVVGQASFSSMFQVRSPPSKNFQPLYSRLSTTLLALSDLSSSLGLAPLQAGF